ncbi:DNA mismatch endonuclease vsr [Streptomyces laurentii]|uniref:DNA mismatch endonuclease vsr n=1 Tax=Streptomyces laurentii TaxID=39478 RepID=A0A160NZ80_STRLU|nr:DNA mismatch endonuclease vsr [Streptomyces laurentii]
MQEPEPWRPPEGSWASSAARRRNMQAIRSRDTKPERLLRQLLHAQGLRYRVAAKPLPDLRRTADIVFRPAKVAVFIDGCYWHGCPEHYVAPKTNQGYWSGKVAGNIARDRDTDRRLADAGWTVLRFWEHEPPEDCASTVLRVVLDRRKRLLERKFRSDE